MPFIRTKGEWIFPAKITPGFSLKKSRFAIRRKPNYQHPERSGSRPSCRSSPAQLQQKHLLQGGGTFDHPAKSGDKFIRYYSVPSNVDEDDIPYIAYGMFIDFELSYEASQFLNLHPSGFAPEDLPSDYLGFWAYVNGYEFEDLPAFVDSLGVVTPVGGYSIVVDVFFPEEKFDRFSFPVFSFPRNYAFLPMVTEINQYGSQTTNIAWPWWLEITPIPSGPSTWQPE
jgi:hypothetical protein